MADVEEVEVVDRALIPNGYETEALPPGSTKFRRQT
jgi:hypothetical protein